MRHTLIEMLAILLICVFVISCATMQSRWEAAKSADTIQSYNEFLRHYPKGELAAQARIKLNHLYEQRDWKDANLKNTVQSYTLFLMKYPRGVFADEASSKLESIYFQEVKLKNIITAYDEFLRLYPQGNHADEARSKREELYQLMIKDWERVQRINTVSAYEEFLNRYPGEEFAEQARYRVMRKYWERAQTIDTLAAYEEFLSFYSRGEFVEEARKKLESFYAREGFVSFAGTVSTISDGYVRDKKTNNWLIEFVTLELIEYPGLRFHIGNVIMFKHMTLLFNEDGYGRRRIRKGSKIHLICKQRASLCEVHSLKEIH